MKKFTPFPNNFSNHEIKFETVDTNSTLIVVSMADDNAQNKYKAPQQENLKESRLV